MNPKITRELERTDYGNIKGGCIYKLLRIYYADVIYKSDEDRVVDDGGLILATPDTKELKKPVEKRKSSIGEALGILISNGNDVNEQYNECWGWEHSDFNIFYNALMVAVNEADEFMVHYLLSHGADANRWPDMDDASGEQVNWYLDCID